MANRLVIFAPPQGEGASVSLRGMRATLHIAGPAAVAAWLIAWPAEGQSPPRLTSDTPEYCQQLHERVSQLIRIADAPPPREVAFLSSEGQRLCEQGHIRGGVLRLRKALMLMKTQADDP